MVVPNSAGGPVHLPVMRDRIVALLAPALQQPGSVYLDCTVGLGGHARAVLEACPQARLIAIDRDPAALDLAAENLADFAGRVELYQAIYHELDEVLAEAGVPSVQAICMDLGLSSLQIDSTHRGFAYATDAPLDMRMDPGQTVTAATIVNGLDAVALARLLRTLGDERFADRIARRIVAAREARPIENSAELVRIIVDAIPMAARNSGGHPAKRSFQALRIAVNDELTSLADALPTALDALSLGGRLAVLAYHSGEDRLVKRAFAQAAADHVPPGVPVVPDALKARFHVLTRGAERPEESETTTNPRAASARLRAIARNQEV
ncbi:MAG: 16S rRNA (cytosine(1402)-N(4))-methyltransferase RsmH [Propionicimonas sp.]